MITPWWLALPACVPLGIAALNLLTWPRGRPRAPADVPRVSVCVPARNEQREIAHCVHAILASDAPIHEVVVLDDNSDDDTPRILAELAERHERLRVVTHTGKLPEGWVGKVHACHLLSQHAEGELLLFVDADTRLTPSGVARLLSLWSGLGVDAVSAVPHQRTGTAFEALMMPLLHLTYVAWLPMPLVWLTSDPRFCAANGQVMLLSANALREVGGFEAIASEIVDDMALLRAFKTAGRRVVFADGAKIAVTRMYDGAADLWSGFSKNAYEGIGGSAFAMLFVMALYLASFVLPYVLLLAAVWVPALWLPALVGVGANLVLRTGLALRHGHSLLSVVAHPVAVVLLCALLVNSRRWYLSDRVVWRGRVYAGRRRVVGA
ncbi:MAG: glycosyltransferase family 2 protein [Myxococcales bacterium]|nr:glycosyltransferase family 2 protein [Myxococcales bacterium]